MRKLKWIVVGAMLITVISVLVGCGAKTDSESGSNTGSGSNNRNTVENLMTDAATGAKEIVTDAATGIKEIATDAATGAKDMMETAKDGMKEMATEVSSAFSIHLDGVIMVIYRGFNFFAL